MAILLSTHALKRLFQRSLSADAVEQVLRDGQVIQHYPDDTPYPSRLMLGWVHNVPVHVVAANTPEGDVVVITAYVPDPALWDDSYTRRKP